MHVYIPSIHVCTWDANMVTECTGNIDSVYQFDPHTHVTYSYSSVYTFKLFIGLLKGKCLHPVSRLVN